MGSWACDSDVVFDGVQMSYRLRTRRVGHELEGPGGTVNTLQECENGAQINVT